MGETSITHRLDNAAYKIIILTLIEGIELYVLQLNYMLYLSIIINSIPFHFSVRMGLEGDVSLHVGIFISAEKFIKLINRAYCSPAVVEARRIVKEKVLKFNSSEFKSDEDRKVAYLKLDDEIDNYYSINGCFMRVMDTYMGLEPGNEPDEFELSSDDLKAFIDSSEDDDIYHLIDNESSKMKMKIAVTFRFIGKFDILGPDHKNINGIDSEKFIISKEDKASYIQFKDFLGTNKEFNLQIITISSIYHS